MIKEFNEGLLDLEERMLEYSELNSFLFNHNKIFMITSNGAYKTPEYNYQPYTFKYGNYDISDYLKHYTDISHT